jgi:hypothetical protein
MLSIYYVNNNKEVDLTTPQVMCCNFYHNNSILNLNPKTQDRRGFIIYNISNGIITLKKHVNLDHCKK